MFPSHHFFRPQEGLIHYDKENIHQNIIIALDPYLKDKEFDPEFIRSKSAAAAGLCSWCRFYSISISPEKVF
jgi:hypothetical protein